MLLEQYQDFFERILVNLNEDEIAELRRILNDYANSSTTKYKNLKVGDEIYLGKYPQGFDENSSSIAWKVINTNDNESLLISKYALDCKPYDNDGLSVTWQGSSLYRYLNNDFYKNSFTQKEKSMLVPFDGSKKLKMLRYGDEEYYIDILSENDVEKYFETPDERKCIGTLHCIRNALHFIDSTNVLWFLKSENVDPKHHPVVTPLGEINTSESVSNKRIAFRPVIKVKKYHYNQ